jgi:hypothetical protein
MIRKAERIGAVVDGAWVPTECMLALDVGVFVELDDGRRVTAPDVNRSIVTIRITAVRADAPPGGDPPAPTEAEVIASVRRGLDEEPIHERWSGLLFRVLRERARPRVWRVARRPLAIELAPSLRRASSSR